KASLYTGRELTDTVKPVDEQTQAQFYRQAIGIAFCQPTVSSFFVFHAFDESDLDRWQSGVYYADGTPKPSAATLATAARDVRGGVIAKCDDLALTPNGTVAYPKTLPLSLKVTCDIDCNIYARLEKLPRHSTTLTVRARGAAGE